MRLVTPLKKREFTAFVREFQKLILEGSESGACTIILDVLLEWQRIAFPALVKQARRRTRAEQFAGWLAEQQFLHGAYWLSSAYAHLAGAAQQQHQMFFTPPPIAERLIDNLLSNGASIATHRYIDPACGGAAFLAPIAVRMREVLTEQGWSPAKIVSHVRQHVAGFELDPFLALLSNKFLQMALYEQLRHRDNPPDFDVTVGDARELCAQHSNKFDVVICNPPYRKMKMSEVDVWREEYGELIEGQPNLYGLFFKVSLDLLRQGRLAGLLTPTSYLSGQYFSRTRTFVLGNADTVQLDIFSGRRETIFLKVQQDVAITVLRKHEARKPAGTSTQVFLLDAAQQSPQAVGRCTLPNSGCAWPVPRIAGDSKLLRSYGQSKARLLDYGFSPRIGAFVWNRDCRKTYPSRAEGVRANASALFPLVWASDITQDGEFKLGRLTGTRSGNAYVDIGDHKNSSIVRRPSVILQRVTSTDQGRRLVGAALNGEFLKRHSGFVGENHIVILEQSNPGLISSEELAEVLRTEYVDRLFRCLSGVTNVSIFELSQLPMPDPEQLRKALDDGMAVEDAVCLAYERAKRR